MLTGLRAARRLWVAGHAGLVTGGSLIAAAITHNPNWEWNIPLGLLVGSLLGAASWPVLISAIEWERRAMEVDKIEESAE